MSSRFSRPTFMLVAGLALAAGLAAPAAAQQQLGQQPVGPAPVAPEVAQDVPVLQVERTIHDFGRITDEASVTTTFTFKNTGTATLKIERIESSCGCTVPALDKLEYAPGESGVVTVEFDPRRREGPQNRAVTIVSNDPVRSRMPLTVRVDVVPLVKIEPRVVQFGQVDKNTVQAVMIDVIGREPNFELVDAQLFQTEGLTVEVFEAMPLEIEGEQVMAGQVLVTVQDSAPLGPIVGQVQIRMRGGSDDRIRTQNISLTGEIVGDIQLLPGRLTFGFLEPGQEFMRRVQVRSADGKPFKITGLVERPKPRPGQQAGEEIPEPIQLGGVEFEVTPLERAEGSAESGYTGYHLTIRGKVDESTPQLVNTRFMVLTDRADEPEVPLRISGRVRPLAATAPRPTPGRIELPAGPGGNEEDDEPANEGGND